MSAFDAAVNLGRRAARRLATVHKPVVRAMRRREREREHAGFRTEADESLRALAALARGRGPIIAGPWLAEVGYEVLYWIPFLRWFCDAHGVPPERLVAVSRGGMDALYAGVAGTYVDIFDLLTPAELAARNAERRQRQEGGGQKQSAVDAVDEQLLAAARARLGLHGGTVCHPSMFFRLFRHVWHGNLPMDFLWTHTRYSTRTLDSAAAAGPARRLHGGEALCGARALDRAGDARGGARRRVARGRRIARSCCSRPSSASTSTATSSCAAWRT